MPSSAVCFVCGDGAPRSRSPRQPRRSLVSRSLVTGVLLSMLGWLAATGPAAVRPAGAQFLHEPLLTRQDAVIRSSTAVLNEIMAIPLAGIPTSLLADAHAVAIVPNVLKGGFVIGARYGRGVLLVRDDAGQWHAPVFITLTGGNIGWQAGVQATDLVLVFRTRRSVDGILAGKFTLGADAAAAAGPVGRQAAAATDGHLAAEILSYSRSRGLFAGVSVDGSVMQVDSAATDAYYQSSPAGPGLVGGEAVVPQAAQRLTAMVAGYAGQATVVEVAPANYQPLHSPPPMRSAQTMPQAGSSLRAQLAQAAVALYEPLDPAWRSYLSLPQAVFAESGQPTLVELQASLRQFDAVAADPRYRALATQPQFQSTHGLLKSYVQSLSVTAAPLELPPPPTTK